MTPVGVLLRELKCNENHECHAFHLPVFKQLMTTCFQPKSLPRFRHGLLANFAGTGWSALVQLACVPLYIKFLGIEAFGLIGFYLMFQAMTQVLDLGLSPTINRQLARYSVQPDRATEARDLVRTLEVGYWLIGFIVSAILVLASTWIATHWIKSNTLPIQTVREALLLMGVLSFIQWPVSLYQGGLMGLQQQVLFNIVRISAVTLNSGGAVLMLWLVAPTIQVFLLWQVTVNAAQSVVLAILLRKCLPISPDAAKFDFSLLRSVGRFAAGMGGIALIGMALTQIDKLVVSKLLSLKVFGYYTLACALASGLSLVSGVVFNVIFPRMTAQVAAGDESGLRNSYHSGSQLMAVLILPLAAVLSFFSFEVLRVWTRNAELASFAAPILRVLVVGSALNALLFLPYALQLAYGWTKLSFTAGVVSILMVIPVIILMTKHFGPIGAALVWAALNISNMLVVVPIMHRRLLPHETKRYFKDIGLPIVATIGIAAIGRFLFANPISPVATLVAVSSVWFFAFVAAVLAAPRIKVWAAAQIMNLRLLYVKRAGSAG